MERRREMRMWMKLGKLLEAKAYEFAASDYSPDRSIRYAQCAEACFWQATGEGDFMGIAELTRATGAA